MKGLIGKKVGMTQVYDEKGILIPVTVIQAGPCVVLALKTKERDGYSAVQFGFGERKLKNAAKSLVGAAKKAGLEKNPPAIVKEFRTEESFEIGSQVKADIFAANDFIDVVGTSKGRGFTGVMRRHHFKGGRDGHGGGWHRKPGSIGCRELPGNVLKGKRMAGHLGNDRVTVQNLKVVKIVLEESLLLVKGAVPGPNGGTVIVSKAKKK